MSSPHPEAVDSYTAESVDNQTHAHHPGASYPYASSASSAPILPPINSSASPHSYSAHPPADSDDNPDHSHRSRPRSRSRSRSRSPRERRDRDRDGENNGRGKVHDGDVDLNKLFISGLHFSMTKQELSDFCRAHHQCDVDARIVNDNQTGRSRGFGFINCSNPEDAAALKAALDNKTVRDRVIKVVYATKPAPGSAAANFRTNFNRESRGEFRGERGGDRGERSFTSASGAKFSMHDIPKGRDGKPGCRLWFADGKCKYGESCTYSHDIEVQGNSSSRGGRGAEAGYGRDSRDSRDSYRGGREEYGRPMEYGRSGGGYSSSSRDYSDRDRGYERERDYGRDYRDMDRGYDDRRSAYPPPPPPPPAGGRMDYGRERDREYGRDRPSSYGAPPPRVPPYDVRDRDYDSRGYREPLSYGDERGRSSYPPSSAAPGPLPPALPPMESNQGPVGGSNPPYAPYDYYGQQMPPPRGPLPPRT